MNIYDITASALTAQRLRMDTIASNLANANSTRREDGVIGAYQRKNVVFKPIMESAMQPWKHPGNSGSSSSGLAGSIPMRSSGNSGIQFAPDGRATIHIGLRESNGLGTGVEVSQITDMPKDGQTMRIHFPGHPDADENGYLQVPKDMRLVYDPSHPDAIPDGEHKGYVMMPNVNVVTEMVDMISASRAYEASVTALQSTKAMQGSALDI